MPAKYIVSWKVNVARAPGEPRLESEWETDWYEMVPCPWDPKLMTERRRTLSIPVIADSQNEAERKAQDIVTLLVGRAYGSFDGNGSPL